MKKSIIIAAIAAVSLSANAADYNVKVAESFSKMDRISLSKMARGMNKKFSYDMPLQLDSITYVERMTLVGATRTMDYRVVVDINKADVSLHDAKLYMEMNSGIIGENLCDQYDTRTMLEGNIKIKYRYYDDNGRFVTSLKFTKGDCK